MNEVRQQVQVWSQDVRERSLEYIRDRRAGGDTILEILQRPRTTARNIKAKLIIVTQGGQEQAPGSSGPGKNPSTKSSPSPRATIHPQPSLADRDDVRWHVLGSRAPRKRCLGHHDDW